MIRSTLGRYSLTSGFGNYEQMKADCESRGLILTDFYTLRELMAIEDFLYDAGQPKAWLGFDNMDADEEWNFNNGLDILRFFSPPGESPWQIGEPNGYGSSPGTSCGVIEPSRQDASSPIRDDDCGQLLPGICKAPTSAPTTDPTSYPTQPTSDPTTQPTSDPTTDPTQPTSDPTARTTTDPTVLPTTDPTLYPTEVPTANPIDSDDSDDSGSSDDSDDLMAMFSAQQMDGPNEWIDEDDADDDATDYHVTLDLNKSSWAHLWAIFCALVLLNAVCFMFW